MRRTLRLLACTLTAVTAARAFDWDAFLFGHLEPDALVVTDVTPEGKKRPPVTPAKPAYYAYHFGGYKELGDVATGEKQPDAKLTGEILVRTLAKQGYLLATKDTPPPSIVLAVWWGSLKPIVTEDPGEVFENEETGEFTTDAPRKEVHNGKEVAMMSGMAKFPRDSHWIGHDEEVVLEEAASDRYFIFVAAYDLAALKQKQKKALWFTRVSVPSDGIELPDAVWTLIASGGPYFGKDTGTVKFVDPEKLRKTEVRVGEATEVSDDGGKTPESPAPAPAKAKSGNTDASPAK